MSESKRGRLSILSETEKKAGAMLEPVVEQLKSGSPQLKEEDILRTLQEAHNLLEQAYAIQKSLKVLRLELGQK